MLTGKIEGKELVIRLPLNPEPVADLTGKIVMVASSYGYKLTDARVNGRMVIVGVHAYIIKPTHSHLSFSERTVPCFELC